MATVAGGEHKWRLFSGLERQAYESGLEFQLRNAQRMAADLGEAAPGITLVKADAEMEQPVFSPGIYNSVLIALVEGESATLLLGDSPENKNEFVMKKGERDTIVIENIDIPRTGTDLAPSQEFPSAAVLAPSKEPSTLAVIEYDYEDKADIAFEVGHATTRDYDFLNFQTKRQYVDYLSRIEKLYPRALVDTTTNVSVGASANISESSSADEALASAKKGKRSGGGAKRTKGRGAGKSESSSRKADAGDVLWIGPRSPAEMQHILRYRDSSDRDVKFAMMFGEQEYAALLREMSRKQRFREESQRENPFEQRSVDPWDPDRSGKERDSIIKWRRKNRYWKLELERGPSGLLEPVPTMRADATEYVTVIDHVFTAPRQALAWECHPQHQLVVVPFEGYSVVVKEIHQERRAFVTTAVQAGRPRVIEAGRLHRIVGAEDPELFRRRGPLADAHALAPHYFTVAYFTPEQLESID